MGHLRTRGLRWFPTLLALALGIAVVYLALPVLAIFLDTTPSGLVASLTEPGATEALWLSLKATLLSLGIVILVGTPAAYALATREFRGRSLLITLIELPLVMPPAVAGIALLATLGPQGLLGGVVEATGVRVVFETAGVVVALVFVSAPFFVRQAQSAFQSVDPTWLEASRTLGASEAATFARVAVPTAAPGLVSGAALAWGRALGEFGATLIFAGSFAGVTQTAPLAIYDLFATDLDAALALAAVLVAVSAGLLLSVKLVASRGGLAGAWR